MEGWLRIQAPARRHENDHCALLGGHVPDSFGQVLAGPSGSCHYEGMTSPDLERLAVLVKKRRAELKLGIEPAAKLAGISKDTWKRVEAGLKVWDTKYTGVETALQWATGSCLRVLGGHDPIVNEQISEDPETRVAEIPKTDLERLIGDAVQSAAIATRGSLTGDEILELNEKVIQELRERGVI